MVYSYKQGQFLAVFPNYPLFEWAPLFCPFFVFAPHGSQPSFCSLFSSSPPILTYFQMNQIRTIPDRIGLDLQKGHFGSNSKMDQKGLSRIEFENILVPYFAPFFLA